MTFICSGNIIWLALVLVVLLLFVYWYVQPTSVLQESPPAVNQSSIKSEAPKASRQESAVVSKTVGPDQYVDANGTISAPIATTATDVKQNLTVLGDPAEAAEVKQWYRERGSFFGSEDIEYKNYDEATLRTLAEGGDIRALHALADLYVDKKISGPEGYGIEATNELFWKAAVNGSTEALYRLGVNMQVSNYSNTGPERENRRHALEILSLYNTAALRGDEIPNLVTADTFKFLNHINLSEDEEKYIEQRSQEIYNHLLQKRIELGLGDFDNSQPESVKKYFERLRAVEGSN